VIKKLEYEYWDSATLACDSNDAKITDKPPSKSQTLQTIIINPTIRTKSPNISGGFIYLIAPNVQSSGTAAERDVEMKI